MSEPLVFFVVVVLQLRIYTANACLRSVLQLCICTPASPECSALSFFHMLSSRWSTRTKHASYRWTRFPGLAWQATWREEGSDIYPAQIAYPFFLEIPLERLHFSCILSLMTAFPDGLWIFFLHQRMRNQKIKSNEWIHPSIYESVNPLNKQWKEAKK